MKPFTESAVDVIKSIPEGKVMTYGQIAALAGSPRGARQVVRILHAMSKKYNLPWHRVVNSKGKISMADHEFFTVQMMSLQSEGVEVSEDGCIHLEQYQYHPSLFNFN